ncbi:hypothetical protein AB0H00_29465 [Nocardia sp. NPDC023852]|uniref:hypothetical protein n=1 Tax=Nocardia sp. NPDC023852 TaxID=3154697 RepID=UPI0033D31576
MTLTFDPSYPATEPDYFAAGPHAPEVGDRTLREEHADISVVLAFAVEAIRASTFGQRRRARTLLSDAQAVLPTAVGQNAQTYRAELAALRAVLTGEQPDPTQIAWGSTYEDSCARAEVRAQALTRQLDEPHPMVLEWLLRDVGESVGRKRARRILRQHLVSYGIDPTDTETVAAIEQRRRDGKGTPHLDAEGYLVYFGALMGPGVYMWPDMTTPLTELVGADIPLSWRGSRVLFAARATDVEVFAGAWLATLTRLIDRWIERIPAGVR